MNTSKQGTRLLHDVLRALCALRGLTPTQVVMGAEAWCDRGTVYRVLAGSTTDPHVSALAAICRALDVRPQEVFERAGLWAGRRQGAGGSSRGQGAGHAELRATWTSVACLPDAERVRITQVVRALVETFHAQRDASAHN